MADIISYVTTEGESLGSALIEATNSEEPGTWTITGKSAYPYEYNFPNGTTATAYYQGFYYNRIDGKIDISLSNMASIGIDLNEKILKLEPKRNYSYPVVGLKFSNGFYWYLLFGIDSQEANLNCFTLMTTHELELYSPINNDRLNEIGIVQNRPSITDDGICTRSDLQSGNVKLNLTQISCTKMLFGTAFSIFIISYKENPVSASAYNWTTTATFIPDEASEQDLFDNLGSIDMKIFNTEYGDYSEGGGYGGGSFDDSSDTFGLPSLPSLGVSEVGFINVYNPSKGQLQGFADELFPNFEMPTPSTATGIEAVAENIANTFEVLGDFAESYVNAGLVNYVIDCHIVPVAPVTSGTAKIKVGFKSFNYTPAKVTSDYVEFDCGSLEIAEYYQNFLDYEGTKAKLYLPFIGFVDIKPEWFQSGKLGVTYHFNIIDGSCIAFVIATSSKSKLKNTVVATFGGNCCVHMPITGVNYSSMISGVVGGAVGIASNASNMIKTNRADKGSVMSNIEGATGIASNLADAVGAKPSIEQSNGYNAGMSFMCYRRPYLLIERPVASFSKNYPKEQGLPLNVTKKLGNMKGFTTCTAPVVDNFHCLEEEKEMIKQALIEGTIF